MEEGGEGGIFFWVIVSETFVPAAVSLCILDYVAGVKARGNDMRTNVGNISSKFPNDSQTRDLCLGANLEGDKTSSIIVKEMSALPKGSVISYKCF